MNNRIRYASAILLTFPLLTGCPEKKLSDTASSESISGSNANLNPLVESLTVVEASAGNNVTGNEGGEESPNTVPTKRESLGDMRSVTKIYDGKTDAGIAVPGFGGLKLGKDEKSLSVYYLETKTVTGSDKPMVYGIGYSVHYLFKKVKKGLSLDKLPVVAASVQLEGNKTQVIYSLNTYGIAGGPLVQFFKPVVDRAFDVEGFGLMQAKIDGIHNILSDSELSKSVVFRPFHFENIQPSDLKD